MVIDLALTGRVQPILTLTPLGPGGMFNTVLVNSVVNNTGYTENLIQNLLMIMGEEGARHEGWFEDVRSLQGKLAAFGREF